MTAPASRPRRAARSGSGHALFASLAATIKLLRWLLAGLVAIYLCSGITRVAPHEDALIYRLGRLQREVHPPGLLLALPAPIDRVLRVPTRTQHEQFINAWSADEEAVASIASTNAAARTSAAASSPAATQLPASLLAVLPAGNPAMLAQLATPPGKGLHPVYDGYTLTGDANLVHARFTIRYRISDPFAYASATAPAELPRLLEALVLDSATHAVAGTPIDAALGFGLESLRTKMRALAQQRIDTARLGLELVAVDINALTPPLATAAAFADVTSAQVEARTTLEQARTYRAQNAPKAASDAYRLRELADADARQLVTRAQGEASAFLALLAGHRAAPGLLESRLRTETVEQVLARVKTKTLLPADHGQLNVLLRETK